MRRWSLLLLFVASTVSAGDLPLPGTKFKTLPADIGRTEVEAACLECHSTDLLVQQRLTGKQWTATVEKMIRWGAAVRPAQKDRLVAYLAKHFGEKNRFAPTRTRPASSP